MEKGEATIADAHRERIMAATTGLLADGGPEAVSTRAVATAAGVQPPTIYRLFGDKQGLLDAAAAHGFSAYLADKHTLEPTGDPVRDLRAGWDLHVEFGLTNPALYALMYGRIRSGTTSPATRAAFEILAGHIHRIAEAGRLAVPEHRAVALVHATGIGTTLSLIATPAAQRDRQLSISAREAIIVAITADAPATTASAPVTAAVTLRAALPQTHALTPVECSLLQEWLDRIAAESTAEHRRVARR